MTADLNKAGALEAQDLLEIRETCEFSAGRDLPVEFGKCR